MKKYFLEVIKAARFMFIFLLGIFAAQMILSGCTPIRSVGDPIGSGIGEMTDELGAERRIGKDEGGLILHPKDDKKIKMAF